MTNRHQAEAVPALGVATLPAPSPLLCPAEPSHDAEIQEDPKFPEDAGRQGTRAELAARRHHPGQLGAGEVGMCAGTHQGLSQVWGESGDVTLAPCAWRGGCRRSVPGRKDLADDGPGCSPCLCAA